MNGDLAAALDRQALLVVMMILACAWTAMLAVARRRQASLRTQRIALASCAAVTAALLASGASRPVQAERVCN